MDKLSGWELSLMNDTQPSCERCGMHMDDENTCCKDEQKVVKFESDQKINLQQSFVFNQLGVIQTLPETNFAQTLIDSPENLPLDFQQKPPNLSMPLFLPHQNFRIWF